MKEPVNRSAHDARRPRRWAGPPQITVVSGATALELREYERPEEFGCEFWISGLRLEVVSADVVATSRGGTVESAVAKRHGGHTVARAFGSADSY